MNLSKSKIEIENEALVDSEEKKRPGFVSSVCDFFISASLFMIFLGLPIFFTSITSQGLFFEKQLYFYFWVLIALVAWTIKGVVFEELKIRKTPLDIPILGFFGAYILATIFSKDHWHSFWGSFGDPSRGLASITVLILVYYIILSNFTQKKIKIALGALLFGNFVIAIWTTLAILNIKFLPNGFTAPLSLIGSLSSLMAYFSIMLPLAIVATLKISQSKLNAILRLLGIVFSIVVVALNLFLIFALLNVAGSWVGLIALLFGMALLLIFILSKIIYLKNFSWAWLPMSVFVVVMVFVMGGQFMEVSRIKLPVEIRQDFKTSWVVARETIKDNFFVGSGPATYGYAFSLYHPKEFNAREIYALRFNQSAGIFNEAIATTGAVGIFFLMIVVLSYLSIELYLLSRSKASDKLYSLGFFVASIIFLVNAVALKTEGSIFILGILLSAMSIAILLKENKSAEEYLAFSLKASPKFALALAFIFMAIASGVVFLFVFIGKVFVADVYMRKAVKVMKYDDNNAIEINKALNLYNKESQYFVQASQLQLVLANQEALRKEHDKKKIEDYLGGAINTAKIAENLGVNNIVNVENLAQVYENSGLYIADAVTLAENEYKRGLELEPQNPAYYLKLAQIKFGSVKSASESDKERIVGESKDLLQKSIDKKSDFAPGYFNMALLQESQNDMDGAIYNMRKAFEIERRNQEYLFNLGRLYQKRGTDEDNVFAEQIFKKIIADDNNAINAHFALANLYEKTKRKDQAIAEYDKVHELLPEEQKTLGPQILKMIENVKDGVSNLQGKTTEAIKDAVQTETSTPSNQTNQIETNLQNN
jgi:tetratricopeptide (TPR) repeat protein